MSKREIVSTEELMNHEALLLVHRKECCVQHLKVIAMLHIYLLMNERASQNHQQTMPVA